MTIANPGTWYTHYGDGSTTGYFAIGVWQVSHSYAAGALVRQSSVTIGNEAVFACVVAGTSNSTQPSWSITRGTKTTDNTVTWIEVSGHPGVNGDISANCPVWVASSATNLGYILYHSGTASLQVCTTSSGNTGGTIPTFSATAGATVTDGSNVWTSLGLASGFGTWAAPHARIENAMGAGSAGIDYYVADNSAQSSSAQITINAISSTTLLTRVLSIDHTKSLPPNLTTALKAGASITVTTANSVTVGSGSTQLLYWWGVTFVAGSTSSASSIIIGSYNVNQDTSMVFDTCQFNITSTSTSSTINVGNDQNHAGTAGTIRWENCTLSVAGSQQLVVNNVRFTWRNTASAVAGSITTPLIYMVSAGGSGGANVLLEALDLSGAPTIVRNTGRGYVLIKNCKLGANAAGQPGGPNLIVDVLNSDSGATNYRNERYTAAGLMSTAISARRSGGATDGATSVSHKIVTSGVSPIAWWLPFETWPLAIWNLTTAATVNVTIHGVAFQSGLPNNDDVWIDVGYLGSSASPVETIATSTKANVGAANAAVTADTSTSWVGTARQNSHSYAVGDLMQPSADSNRVYLCTAATTSSATSEPGGYATASDGSAVTDGGCTFQACTRFVITVALTSPSPAQAGYIQVSPKFAKASTTFLIDPLPVLS